MDIQIAANFEAQGIKVPLEYWCRKLGILGDITMLPTGQTLNLLLGSNAESGLSAPIAILLIDFYRWCRDASGSCTAEELAQELSAAILAYRERCNPSNFLVLLFCPNVNGRSDSEEKAIQVAVAKASEVSVITRANWEEIYPFSDSPLYFDSYADEIAALPYTELGFATLATILGRRVALLSRPAVKVIITDCDDTLWSGICAEQEAYGVTVSDEDRQLQEFLIAQTDKGVLVCVCSKNNSQDVQAVFQGHRDMALTTSHITKWAVNWSPKADNVGQVLAELGLQESNMVYLDDDPIECAMIRAAFPKATVVHLPTIRTHRLPLLHSLWHFDQMPPTLEAQHRSRFYKDAQVRESAASQGLLDDFLASIQLKVNIFRMSELDVARATELSCRVNQFNLNGNRLNAGEVRRLLQSCDCWMVEACDRFGDYGRVGLLIYSFVGQDLMVHTWLLSCRALGRRIENLMLRHLLMAANRFGVCSIAFQVKETERNIPFRTFLEKCGAQETVRGWLYICNNLQV